MNSTLRFEELENDFSIAVLPCANAWRDINSGYGLVNMFRSYIQQLEFLSSSHKIVVGTEIGRIPENVWDDIMNSARSFGFEHIAVYRKDVPIEEQTNDYSKECRRW